MKRSDEATYSALAVSLLNKETAMNTEQTLDTRLHIDKGVIIAPDFRNENNANMATGYRGPTTVYKRGYTGSLSLNFDKLMPHELLLLLGYGLGSIVTTTAGSTGYKHVITPLATRLDAYRSLPTFSAAMQYAQIEMLLWASGAVKGGSLTFAKDDWLKAKGDIMFSGKRTSNITKITTASLENAGALTTLDLTDAADTDYPVAGSTAADRLANIDYVRAQLNADGIWHDVVVSAASAATPAVLTIVAPGAGTDEVVFEIAFKTTQPAWATLPAELTEPSLYITDLQVLVGGKYNAVSGLVEGGRDLGADIESFEYTWSVNGAMEMVPNGGNDYAARFITTALTQNITVSRAFSDLLMAYLESEDTEFAIQARAIGPEFESGHTYEGRVCFPRCMVMNPKRQASGDRLTETSEIAVLEGNASGSVVATVITDKAATCGA